MARPGSTSRKSSPEDADRISRYRRMRRMTIVAVSAACLLPLFAVTAINFYLYKQSFQTASIEPILSVTAVSKRSLESFLTERLAAAEYVVSRERPSDLFVQENVESIFQRMKTSFGGLVDIGVIDAEGVMRTYVGPYSLLGKNYKDQDWFTAVGQKDTHISDVFLGHRRLPHFVIAVRKQDEQHRSLIFRATVDMEEIERRIDVSGARFRGDAFLINRRGMLETSSRLFGKALQKFPLAVPEATTNTADIAEVVYSGRAYLMGYAPIDETDFVFAVLVDKADLYAKWTTYEGEMLALLLLCVPAILAIVIAVTRKWVGRIQEADERREAALHASEHVDRMATIGRLAAGVAHEINNPLAVINEKAGLIEDLLAFSPASNERDKLLKQTGAIVRSVNRCSAITRRLLGLARPSDTTKESVQLRETVAEVLGFLEKEAAYRAIEITMDGLDDLPPIVSDKSRLQQLFLNLISNAFDAVENGGHLTIAALPAHKDWAEIAVSDNGCGIEEAHLDKIFDPFFTTKKTNGTGLGLSISYGIVQQLGGRISVKSEVGKGTTFTVSLPLGGEEDRRK